MSNLTDSVTGNFFEEFINRNAPKSKTFEFILDHPDRSRDVLVFRTTRDHDELRQIAIAAVEFGKKVEKGQYAAFLKGLEICQDVNTHLACYHLARRMVRFYHVRLVEIGEECSEETVEMPLLTELDFLKMASQWPHGFEDIRRTLDTVLAVDVRVREADLIEETKKP